MTTKIQPYCHRIGRTGRAGKSGIASTYLTDDDSEVMFELKNYLESTSAAIPAGLARHPAAQVAVGSRDDKGKLISTGRKDSVMYARE